MDFSRWLKDTQDKDRKGHAVLYLLASTQQLDGKLMTAYTQKSILIRFPIIFRIKRKAVKDNKKKPLECYKVVR